MDMDKNQQGIEFMQQGKYEEAAKVFNEAIEENPNEPVAYINFGNVLTAVGETDKAVKFYKKAIELDENAAAAYYSLGNLYYESDSKLVEAKDMFEKAIRLGLDNSDAYFMLGLTLMALDQPKLAMPYLQRTVELSPEDVDARFQYALCLANAELYDELINQLNMVVEQDPGHADAYYNLGVAFAGYREDAKAAMVYFDKALEAQPDHMLAAHGKKLLEEMNAE
jgi:tetratricopeptide (TPR) repeat protein